MIIYYQNRYTVIESQFYFRSENIMMLVYSLITQSHIFLTMQAHLKPKTLLVLILKFFRRFRKLFTPTNRKCPSSCQNNRLSIRYHLLR